MIGIVLRIGLRNVGPIYLAAAQLLFQHFDGILRIDIHRIVDLDLQNQVRSPAQIQAQVDAPGPGRKSC